ncbi:MAG: beta-CASP ribonuclease aCPSF1 [Candidatus Woesearchaeota archaeon]
MSDIIKEILKDLPEGKICDAGFEGANIVLYTKDKEYLANNKGTIKNVVDKLKKRIELRPDPSNVMEIEKARKTIESLIPPEVTVSNIFFDPQRSLVTIEADKPGLVIGKQGGILRDIKEKTLWIPQIKRTPAIRSEMIENIRSVLYQFSDFRRKFLNKVGHRVYDGWIRSKKEEWVRITYLGSGRHVGKSAIFLQTPESRILLDCGIDIANEKEPYPHLDAPEFRIDELDAVIISHAHLDHTGFLPYLIKFGYKGPIYCTEPTRDIMAMLQLDFVKIQINEGKDPIYTSDEILEMVKQTIVVDYEEVTDITPDVRLTFHNAGHIIGSAMVHLHIGNGLHNLLYSADLKFTNTMLLDRAEYQFNRVETLLLESTYGGKENVLPPREEEEAQFCKVIQEVIANKGRVLIPVLGVGRAQEIMMLVENLHREGKLPPVPVLVDGIVWDITAIHTGYPEFLNSRIRKQIFHKNENPFLSEIFKRVGSGKERKQYIEQSGPFIALATSGMLQGGPSVEYLKALAPYPENALLFVSYQGEGSLGRRIQRGEKEIVFKEGNRTEVVPIRLRLETFEGFSGHAGRKELLNYIHKMTPKPKRIILNHGESSRSLDLCSAIQKIFKIETLVPRNLETIRLR